VIIEVFCQNAKLDERLYKGVHQVSGGGAADDAARADGGLGFVGKPVHWITPASSYFDKG
jgi:hypothetical protein